jgi:hypothetical protein
MSRYLLLQQEHREFHGKLVYRILNTESGQRGGFLSSENNLAQLGTCFVHGESIVAESAQVSGNAQIYGVVYGNARIEDNAEIYGVVSGNAVVRANAKVYGTVTGDTVIEGSTVFYGTL